MNQPTTLSAFAGAICTDGVAGFTLSWVSALILLHLDTADVAQRRAPAPRCLPPCGVPVNCSGFSGLVCGAAAPYKEREPALRASAQNHTLSAKPPVKPCTSLPAPASQNPPD